MVKKDVALLVECIHCNNKVLSNIKSTKEDKKYYKKEDLQKHFYDEGTDCETLIDAEMFFGIEEVNTWYVLECTICDQLTFTQTVKTIEYKKANFYGDEIGYPDRSENKSIILYPNKDDNTISTPNPSSDMPSEIIVDYNEARAVFKYSTRASAALLRLAIQKLCKYLGLPGKNINDDIAALVKNGLPVKIQRSLDIVRILGNNAVHPGELDLRDDQETVLSLFKIVNFIIEEMITRPKEIEEIYNKLPENARKGIEKRDQTK